MTLFSLFRSKPTADLPHRLYRIAGDQSRLPVFYTDLGVADTFDGRFDMLVLHVHLLIRRLGADPADGKRLAQQVFDVMLGDLDQGLRLAGVGDVGIGKRVKKMSNAYYGRAIAYDAALDGDDRSALAQAIRRNVYRERDDAGRGPETIAAYVRACRAMLDGLDRSAIDAASFRFPDPDLEAVP